MNKIRTKYLHVGQYVAAFDVEVIDAEPPIGWGPSISMKDAYLLDDVRELLKQGNVTAAPKKARVFKLNPVQTNGDA